MATCSAFTEYLAPEREKGTKLTARNPGVSYLTRLLWVDRERMLTLKEERYAKSGKLLKTSQVLEVKQPPSIFFPRLHCAGKGFPAHCLE